MSYDQRADRLKAWFKEDMLVRFSMPKDLDPKTGALDVIDCINSNLPSHVEKDKMDNLLSAVTREIVQSARTRTLPSVKEFSDVVRKIAQSHGAPLTERSSPVADRYTATAKSIRLGLAISDSFLKSPSREILKEKEGITDLDLEPYDKYMHNTAHKQS